MWVTAPCPFSFAQWQGCPSVHMAAAASQPREASILHMSDERRHKQPSNSSGYTHDNPHNDRLGKKLPWNRPPPHTHPYTWRTPLLPLHLETNTTGIVSPKAEKRRTRSSHPGIICSVGCSGRVKTWQQVDQRNFFTCHHLPGVQYIPHQDGDVSSGYT